jgi:hypothetical protein
MREMRLPAKVRRRRPTWPRSMAPGRFPVDATRRLGTGRIRVVQETNPSSRSSAPEERRPEVAMDESRVLMMRRVKQMTVEERLALFERLSRRVTWVRSAKRVR